MLVYISWGSEAQGHFGKRLHFEKKFSDRASGIVIFQVLLLKWLFLLCLIWIILPILGLSIGLVLALSRKIYKCKNFYIIYWFINFKKMDERVRKIYIYNTWDHWTSKETLQACASILVIKQLNFQPPYWVAFEIFLFP